MLSIRRGTISLIIAALTAMALGAQTPNISGTWKLNESASAADPGVVFSALGGNAGIPMTLYVTQAKNGTVIIGSDMNTSHARTYIPGAMSSTPIGTGAVTVDSQWDGATLVAEGEDTASSSLIREELTLSTDGNTLTVTITVTKEGVESSSTLVYEKATAEAPCKEWPTPCKDWSANATPAGSSG